MNNIDNIEDIIVGIDLGTTNSCISVWRNNNLEIIPDEYGNRTIPSYIAYTNINRYVGHEAKNQKDLNSKNVFYEIKRLIGRKYEDKFITKEKQFISYNLGKDENNNIVVISDIDDKIKNKKKEFTPEELQSVILKKLQVNASKYLGFNVVKAVITVPAYFNDGQRQATKDSASIAGLECVRIINEPTAAGLAYGLLDRTTLNEQQQKEKIILVYDFGGGTLDVSVMNVSNGLFEVLGSSGNTRLGGSDFENRLMMYSSAKFAKQNNIVINNLSCLSLQKLRQSCENAKITLSTSNKTFIAIKDFYDNKDLYITITRNELEEMCGDLFLLCLKPVEDALNICDMLPEQIDEIIMVGGMTRMPKIRNLLKDKFKKEPNCSINPDEAISAGAAIQAFMISHKQNPFSKSITLLDTLTLSLGVEIIGGIMDIIIPRGSILPVISEPHLYSIDEDYADKVLIKIFEGERTSTNKNFFVGEFELTGIKPELRGIPEIEVIFKVDSNGIISVSAEDTKTHDKNTIIVTSNKGRLTQMQIQDLIEESKEMETKDELYRQLKLYHYEINELCNNVIYNLYKNDFKTNELDKKCIKEDIDNIFKILKENKIEDIELEKYIEIIDNLKKKYSVLILKPTNTNSNLIDNIDKNINCVSIYDDDDKNICENILELENKQLNITGLDNQEKIEIKTLRNNISELCHSIFNIINSNNFDISLDHKKELKDYIDDTLLWLHICSENKKEDYIKKIDNINNTCDTIISHYSNKDIFKKDSIKEEVENLCYTIKIFVENNNLSQNIISDNNIDDILLWLYDNDNVSVNIDDKCLEHKLKLDIIYNELNNNKNNEINISGDDSSNSNICVSNTGTGTSTGTGTGTSTSTSTSNNSDNMHKGTSIFDIAQQQQKEIIENMLNGNFIN